MLELIVTALVIMKVCEIIGKLIPDYETGFAALCRRVCKTIALYFTNKE